MLFEPPFTDVNDQGLLGVFDDGDAVRIISIIDEINERAELGVNYLLSSQRFCNPDCLSRETRLLISL